MAYTPMFLERAPDSALVRVRDDTVMTCSPVYPWDSDLAARAVGLANGDHVEILDNSVNMTAVYGALPAPVELQRAPDGALIDVRDNVILSLSPPYWSNSLTTRAVGLLSGERFEILDNSANVIAVEGAMTNSVTPGGSGDVVGPASATDNAAARFDGTTGKLLQDSSVTITDAGSVGLNTTTPNRLAVPGHALTIFSPNSGDSSVIDLGGNRTTAGAVCGGLNIYNEQAVQVDKRIAAISMSVGLGGDLDSGALSFRVADNAGTLTTRFVMHESGRVIFGANATAGIPALKPNGAALNVRFADDSADATLTAATQTTGDNSTNVATTAFVTTAISSIPGGNVVGPASALNNGVVLFSGTTGKLIKDSAVQMANVAVKNIANIFTGANDFTGGSITAPTQTAGDNSTKVATTAFVTAAATTPAAHHATHETGGSDAIAALSGAVITSGTVADAYLSSNVPLLNAANTFTADQTISRSVPSLISRDLAQPVDARNFRIRNFGQQLSFAAVSDALAVQFTPLTLDRTGSVIVGANLTANGVVQATGGLGSTALNAANLTGTIADARLSSNVPLKNTTNTFSAIQTVSLANPAVVLNDSSQAANQRVFRVSNTTQLLLLQAFDDAQTTVLGTVSIDRTGVLTAAGLGTTPLNATQITGGTLDALRLPASVPLTVSTTPQSWAPLDLSGAGLTLGGAGTYYVIGKLVLFTCSITWPTTSNGAGVLVGGLPYVATAQFGGMVAYSEVTTVDKILVQVGQSYFFVYNSATVAITNAQMSGHTSIFSGFYWRA